MKPTANSQQPTANSQQPTANSQQPTANSQQPTVCSVPLAISNLHFSFFVAGEKSFLLRGNSLPLRGIICAPAENSFALKGQASDCLVMPSR
jgi:hypothetical protein